MAVTCCVWTMEAQSIGRSFRLDPNPQSLLPFATEVVESSSRIHFESIKDFIAEEIPLPSPLLVPQLCTAPAGSAAAEASTPSPRTRTSAPKSWYCSGARPSESPGCPAGVPGVQGDRVPSSMNLGEDYSDYSGHKVCRSFFGAF